MIEGGCFCGAVRYQMTDSPESSGICHCESCRRASGAPSVAWVTVEREKFRFAKGEPTAYPPTVEVWLADRVPWQPTNAGLRHYPGSSLD